MPGSVAAVLHRPGPVATDPLVVDQHDIGSPGPGEVVIDVAACGVCRTDLQLVEGDLPAHRLPIVPGHQVVGRIAAVGDAVDDRAVGDRVGVAWIAGVCGACRFCTTGRENLCELATFTGWDRDGGYARRMVARADFTYPLPGGASDEALAPLLCGGVIGYRCLGVAGVDRGDRVGLYGFGASATVVLQVLLHWGCEVHVATRSAAEQARALELGAASAGSYDERPPAPLDEAITFAPVGDVVVEALRSIDRGGTVAVNAIHLDRIPEFSYDLLWWERTVRSVANVTRDDVRALLELAASIPLETRYEVHPLADANEALRRVETGEVRTAAVLKP